MEEFVFASHTSIISKHLLLEKLQEEGIIDEYVGKKKRVSVVDKANTGKQLTERQQILLNKNKTTP
jgi:hypothetical protein